MYSITQIRNHIAMGALALTFTSAPPVVAESGMNDPDQRAQYTEMTPGELADHLIFEARGFDLDQKTQEGGTVRDRQQQDPLQQACSALMGKPVDSSTASRVIALAREDMEYPEGGIELGDWKQGEKVANSGYGYRVGHKTDDHSQRSPGGNCVACHRMDPGVDAAGTIGPSLIDYADRRGTDAASRRFTYQMIYNPHVNFPCTRMPRFGANGFLTEEQIRDVMAYLLDPASPVNQ